MGCKLKDAREKRGLTQCQLAEMSGVSRTIISGLESGRVVNTTAGTLKKLADALSTSISEIFSL